MRERRKQTPKRLYGLCSSKDGHYTTAKGVCMACNASLSEAVDLLIALHEALERQEEGNDGEWESDEVGQLRLNLAEFVEEQ